MNDPTPPNVGRPASRVCAVCGFANPPDAVTCQNCGLRIFERPESSADSPSRSVSEIAARSSEHSSVSPPPSQPAGDQPETGGPSTLPIPREDCPRCGHSNRVGVPVCANCGLDLRSARQTGVGSFTLAGESAGGDERSAEDYATVDRMADERGARRGTDIFEDNMILRLEVEGAPNPLLVYPALETIIGRRDPNGSAEPDVDLTGYAGYRMGVSRQHAALRLKDKTLEIRDLGSSNGTYLNGIKLAPHRPEPLHDGDRLTLGRMAIHIHFQIGDQRGS